MYHNRNIYIYTPIHIVYIYRIKVCVCFRKFLVSDCTVLKLHNDVAYTLHIYIYIYSKLSRSTYILDTLIQLEKSDKKRMKRIKISLLGMHFVVAVVVCVFWVESETDSRFLWYLNSQIYIYIYIFAPSTVCRGLCGCVCVCTKGQPHLLFQLQLSVTIYS